MKIPMIATLAASLLAAAATTRAADPAQEIALSEGTTASTVTGHVKGAEVDVYTVQAKQGQTLHAKLTSESIWAYFDVLPPGGGEPLFIGARRGDEFTAPLPSDGEYTLNVHLSGYGAMKGEAADYSLEVSRD